jgi:hypothetical protein
MEGNVLRRLIKRLTAMLGTGADGLADTAERRRMNIDFQRADYIND